MKFILISLLVFSSWAMAGTEGGNGGDVLVCPDRVELLDFYEAGIRNEKIKAIFGENEWEIAAKVLSGIAKNNPTRSRLYKQGLNNFKKEIEFVTDTELPDIPDQGDLPIPRNCELKQIAIQAKPTVKDSYESWNLVQPNRYKIDLNLWQKLSPNHKAGLILHELILREAIHSLGHTNSKQVRKLNSFWWVEHDQDTKLSRYNLRLASFDFTSIDNFYGDFVIFTKPETYTVNYEGHDIFYKIIPLGGSGIWYKNNFHYVDYVKVNLNNIAFETFVNKKGNPLKIFNSRLAFYGKIRFKADTITVEAETPFNIETIYGPTDVSGSVSIGSNGRLLEGKLEAPLVVRELSYNLTLNAGSLVFFFNDGTLRYTSSARGVAKGVSDQDYFICDNAEIKFDVRYKEVDQIKGYFKGHILSECSPTPIWVGSYVTTNLTGQFFKELLEPRSCEGADGNTYQVSTDIIFTECLIKSAKNLPETASPCRWK